MTPQTDLATIRGAFARQIVHAARSRNPRLEAAFAAIRREEFLGPGPWQLMRDPSGYNETPDADPVFLYQDVAVSILADKRLNNGQPSYLAMLIDLCAIGEDERVVHVGTGTGYYTAILGRLAGPNGQVLGLEFEADLAACAARHLAAAANTTIIQADGWTHPLGEADAILVNAGTPRPAVRWLDALKPGGRLVLPLATPFEHEGRPMTRGAIFRITRDAAGFAASCEMGTVIYPCVGGGDPGADVALAAAFERGDARKVTRLRRERIDEDARCWLRGDGWALTFD